jgi:glycerophosphoryl diester phosphodiesterase
LKSRAAPLRRWQRRDRPWIIAHRGASADAPENTLAAFRLAREQGADGIELDVQRCRSGEVVVFHDHDLQRLAARTGRVAELDWGELSQADVRGERIPRLEDALAAIGSELLINVELKTASGWAQRVRDDGLARAVAALLARSDARVLVSSFDPLLLARFRAAAPTVPTGLLFSANQSVPLRRGWAAWLVRPTALHPQAQLVDAVALAHWRARGFAVHTWTVDDPAELRALAALGVDAVITNRPALARRALDLIS